MKIEDYKKMKKYGQGALKRKLGITKKDTVMPGDMISKMNKMKNQKMMTAIKGLI